MKNIFWLRNDLRLEDNTALNKAIEISYEEKKNLLLIFHINTEQVKERTYSNDYFFSALNVFYKQIKNLGSDILFLYGEPENAFKEFLKTHKDIEKVFFNVSERGYGLIRDEKVSAIFEENNIEVFRYFDKHIHSAGSVLTGDNKNYKVFTPYFNKWSTLAKGRVLKFEKDKYKKIMYKDFSNPYKIKLEEILKNRFKNFEDICGEEKALKDFNDFVEDGLVDYIENRDNVVLDSNSRMSKYLSTGQISVRKMYERLLYADFSKGKEAYIRQLAWRDFYNMIYSEHPAQEKQEIIEKYRGISWNRDKYLFNIWKLGLTGYPIVDAAMRNLRATGTMHNRLRMIVASFLIKDLLIDWRMGEEYFKEMLIDYDSASNIGSWQWAASTGTDACPYFRIFNPTTQSKKFDEYGEYIKEWIPELKEVESKYIHEPTKYKNKIKNLTYPEAIVVHKEQRLKALDMYSKNIYIEYEDMRDEFIKRYTFHELDKLKNLENKELVSFHTKNKYLYFTYDVNIKDELGSLFTGNTTLYSETFRKYRKLLVKLFETNSNRGKMINAYEHVYGYFKKVADTNEKKVYALLIKNYTENEVDDSDLKKFLLDLAYKYDVEYIEMQSLLNII